MTPNGGGAKAGLQPGDRIVTIKGKQVEGSTGEKRVRDARKLLSRLDTGTPIRIGYVRDGKPASVEVAPQIDQVVYILRDDGSLTRAEGNVRMQRDDADGLHVTADNIRSEEHTSELQSLMRISYAVFCLKKKKHENKTT